MLRFIVEETLAGRGSRLKGVTVAQSVFGRDETFDQQSDPVVRLEARRLRSDLDSYYVDAGSQDPVRVTVPKGGYVPHFAWQDHDAPLEPVDATATPQAPTEAGTPVKRRRRRLTLVAALFVVGALLALGTTFIGRPGANSNATADRKPAIIVLPFEAFGDIDDIGLIASGVTEELIANLMMFKDFRVYSTTTSFRQDADADPETVGRDLGVSFVVTGVMQSQNGQVYLRARLVDTQTGEVRWSGSYEEPLDAGDLFVAQKDLAVAISTELGEPYGAVNDAIGQRMANNSTPSMPSYTCILRAYDYRRTFSEALFVPAMACLKQAVIRDPNYADAWAMLGWLQLDSVRRSFAPETEHPARMAAAFEAASHAVELEPRSPRALAALSAVTFYQGDYVTAEALQREVLALNPNDPDTLAQLGWRLAVRGNREGLTYLEQAVTRSANPPGWYHNLRAVYAYLDGDYLRALAEAKKSATSGSAVGMSFVAMSHAKLGNMDAARDALAAMTEGWPLLGRDPAAAYRLHHTDETIVAVLVEGLLSAGWAPPSADYQ
jgi:TolB-like protein